MIKPLSLILATILLISLQSIHPVSASSIIWYDSCEDVSAWSSASHVQKSINHADYMEGSGSLRLKWYASGSTESIYLNIPNAYNCTSERTPLVVGFWLKIVSFPLGNPINNETQFRIFMESDINRWHGIEFHATYSPNPPPYRFWHHLLSGASSGNKYDYWSNTWQWCQLIAEYDPDPTKFDFTARVEIEGDSEGMKFSNYDDRGEYDVFIIKFMDMIGTGRDVELLIDYVRLMPLQEFPPTLPPPPERIRVPPLEHWIPLGMGLGGLIMIVITPFLFVWKRKKRWEYIPYYMMMLIIGLGCVVGWLWG